MRPAALALALLLFLAACGDDGTDLRSAPPTSEPPATEPAPVSDPTNTAGENPFAAGGLGGPLPPIDALGVGPLYDDALAALGLELTNRGGLIDKSNGGYVKSEAGDHLALYVRPTGDLDAAGYAANLLPLTTMFVPSIFERFPGLVSFDICQYPAGIDTPPFPLMTQVDFTREQVDGVPWDTLDVDGLLALRETGAVVNLDPSVEQALQRDA